VTFFQYVTAVNSAIRNKMDLAVNVTAGSSMVSNTQKKKNYFVAQNFSS
jgi:hypothetical protein